MIHTLDYNLPDISIKNGEPNQKIFVWQPDSTYIILGRSNKAEAALKTDLVLKDNIIVMQRPSGGETVILSPKMLVIAALLPIIKGIASRDYFIKCNDVIIEALKNFGVKNLSTKGISDISIGEKKILGSAIYRAQDSVFYHAVLNINEDINLISRYLNHPKREPDYRKGRNHNEFVTSLWEQNYQIDAQDFANKISNRRIDF